LYKFVGAHLAACVAVVLAVPRKVVDEQSVDSVMLNTGIVVAPPATVVVAWTVVVVKVYTVETVGKKDGS